MPRLTNAMEQIRCHHENDTAVELRMERLIAAIRKAWKRVLADGIVTLAEARLLCNLQAALAKLHAISLRYNREICGAYCRLTKRELQLPLFGQPEVRHEV